ncbi:MAG: hypothetical protein CMQ14_03390 [Gammaproteobacteria bacterium]|nr:hypothetical protein [Gammaproteobacteria bacterium]
MVGFKFGCEFIAQFFNLLGRIHGSTSIALHRIRPGFVGFGPDDVMHIMNVERSWGRQPADPTI